MSGVHGDAKRGDHAAVDPALPTPMYRQIFDLLRDQILDGALMPGDLLPPESEIERRYGVSRITARRALNDLAAHGLVVRSRGRGTVVAQREVRSPLLASVEGLLENNLAMGLATDVRVLDLRYTPADAAVAEALCIPRGTIVQMATRVRYLDGTPFSYLTTHVPEGIGRSYNREELARTPLLKLLERSGAAVARADQVISAVNADRKIARPLLVEPGTALLRVERTAFGADDRPIQNIVALYRPDVYRYRMVLTRVEGDPTNVWAAESPE